MTKKKNPPNEISFSHPWDQNDHAIWLGSAISLYRNLDKYKFPPKIDDSRQKQILALVKKEAVKSESLSNPRLLEGSEITPKEKEYLTEHFLSLENYQQAHTGEGFIVDDSGKFLATINMHDHLHFKLIDTNSELESSWNKLVKIETSLGKSLTYSYSPRFGFLTGDPASAGTGMKAAVYLQLSGLIHSDRVNPTIQKYMDEGISITGIQGSPKEVIGDIIVVQNTFSLGVTEENIISNLHTFCTKLHLEEKSTRKEIAESGNPKIKDKISRAYAILLHSYQLEAIEALNAISLLKLGTEFGWVEGINGSKLNQLLFNCRRGHLLSLLKEDSLPKEELSQKRAKYIHETLEGITLKEL